MINSKTKLGDTLLDKDDICYVQQGKDIRLCITTLMKKPSQMKTKQLKKIGTALLYYDII